MFYDDRIACAQKHSTHNYLQLIIIITIIINFGRVLLFRDLSTYILKGISSILRVG